MNYRVHMRGARPALPTRESPFTSGRSAAVHVPITEREIAETLASKLPEYRRRTGARRRFIAESPLRMSVGRYMPPESLARDAARLPRNETND